MKISNMLIAYPAILVAAPALTLGCISTDSGITEATKGCDEFQSASSFAELQVDAKVKVFMQAAAEFRGVATDTRAAVKEACVGIATDLGADDTWSSMGDSDDAISNAQGTGACDAASTRVTAIMEAHAEANFALTVTRGACHLDFDMQTQCEARCDAEKVCDAGSVEERCEPGELSVVCQGSCTAGATCEGTMEVAANCMGQCESTCTGECKGTCTGPDGKRTENDPNCHGKCSSSCNGTCRGLCKVEAEQGLSCGASVSCKGGCEGSFTDPKCETIFTPPKCTIDQKCLDACSAMVAAHPICDPPHVELLADITVSADVAVLQTTIDAHLPKLLAIAEVQGNLVVEAGERLVASGEAVLEASGTLSGKSVSCAAVAAKASAEAALHLRVSVQGSAGVTDSCTSRAQ